LSEYSDRSFKTVACKRMQYVGKVGRIRPTISMRETEDETHQKTLADTDIEI